MVRAKTGTLGNAATISGYLGRTDGVLVVSLMYNGGAVYSARQQEWALFRLLGADGVEIPPQLSGESGAAGRGFHRLHTCPVSRPARITLAISGGLLLVLVAGSYLTESQRFPYGAVSITCLVASGLAGFLVGRLTGPAIAAASGAFVSLAAPAVAWFALNSLPPWRSLSPHTQPMIFFKVILVLVLGGAVAGLVGGIVTGAGRRNPPGPA